VSLIGGGRRAKKRIIIRLHSLDHPQVVKDQDEAETKEKKVSLTKTSQAEKRYRTEGMTLVTKGQISSKVSSSRIESVAGQWAGSVSKNQPTAI